MENTLRFFDNRNVEYVGDGNEILVLQLEKEFVIPEIGDIIYLNEESYQVSEKQLCYDCKGCLIDCTVEKVDEN